MKNTVQYRVIRGIFLTFLILYSLIILYPVFIMLIDSCKTGTELAKNSWGLPKDFTLENYADLIIYNSGTLIRSYFNSIFIATAHTVLVLLISSLAGYAFAKYNFKGKNALFVILLATMMVPAEITMPGVFLMFSKIKAINSYSIQIFPGIASVFCMYMLRENIATIPDSLIESASLEGASTLQVFWKIIVPLAKPAIGAMAILTFLGKFNDYLWPKTLLTKTEVMPIMVMLPTLSVDQNVYIVPWELMLAGCTLVSIPLIIVFLIFQDQFMSGITMGAVKE